ncbi:MAG: hypothetical protein ABL952_06980 [Pyrinomonadaceae bacterium]
MELSKFFESPMFMVGTARFELTTSRTPTNLRVDHKFSGSLNTQ